MFHRNGTGMGSQGFLKRFNNSKQTLFEEQSNIVGTRYSIGQSIAPVQIIVPLFNREPSNIPNVTLTPADELDQDQN